MAETITPNESLAGYRGTVTWFVGLSAAAVGGAFVNLDKVASAVWQVRLLYFAAAFGFGISVICGIQLVFWLAYAANQEEKKTRIAARIADPDTPEEKKDKQRDQLTEVTKRTDSAYADVSIWHKRSHIAFEISLGLAGLLLLCGVIFGKPCPQCPPADETHHSATISQPPSYDIVLSAVHTTHHGKEAHTFLVNKSSGEVWQMVCHKDDDGVEFRKVHRRGFDRQLEDPN